MATVGSYPWHEVRVAHSDGAAITAHVADPRYARVRQEPVHRYWTLSHDRYRCEGPDHGRIWAGPCTRRTHPRPAMKTRNTPTLLVPKQPDIQEGVVRHRPLPEPDLREAALAWAEEAAVVVVHCTIPPVADSEDYFIRRRTYLADANTGRRFRLLHAEGIAHPPYRSASRPGTAFQFTLHFEALPGTCTVFSLVERSPHQFPFVVHGLERNRMDVYRVTLVE